MALKFSKVNDKWLVLGPVDEVKLGKAAVPLAHGGTRDVVIVSVSRPFNRGGVMYAFGTVDPWAHQRKSEVKQEALPVVKRLAAGESVRTRTAAGPQLKQWLRDNGMSNAKFTTVMNITLAKLYDWFNGYSVPDLREATCIQQITGVSAIAWTEAMPLHRSVG